MAIRVVSYGWHSAKLGVQQGREYLYRKADGSGSVWVTEVSSRPDFVSNWDDAAFLGEVDRFERSRSATDGVASQKLWPREELPKKPTAALAVEAPSGAKAVPTGTEVPPDEATSVTPIKEEITDLDDIINSLTDGN